MTNETETEAPSLRVAVCGSCGTLYRTSDDRHWCPACSTDADETIDLGGLIDMSLTLSRAFAELVTTLGERLDPGEGMTIGALMGALLDRIDAVRTGPVDARATGDAATTPGRRARRSEPQAAPEPEPTPDQASAPSQAGAALDDGVEGSPTDAAAADPGPQA